MPYRSAQTNVQLFNQMHDRGYAERDLVLARDAYVLSVELFSGLYRSCGKPFVAHAVGTAGVLVEVAAPIALVAAALTHSAYTLGEFGTLRRSIDRAKRARVRRAIGAEAEAVVHAYAALAWSPGIVAERLRRSAQLTDLERDVLTVRLANEVDEYADLAALYSADADARIARARSFVPACVALAEALGAIDLGARLAAEGERTLAAGATRVRTTASPISTLVPPASHAARPHVVLRAWLDRIRRTATGMARRPSKGTT